MREPKKKDRKDLTPEEKRRRSKRLNLILMIMSVGWGLILISTKDRVFVRWLAAAALLLVGLTGFLGIGTERTRNSKKQ